MARYVTDGSGESSLTVDVDALDTEVSIDYELVINSYCTTVTVNNSQAIDGVIVPDSVVVRAFIVSDEDSESCVAVDGWEMRGGGMKNLYINGDSNHIVRFGISGLTDAIAATDLQNLKIWLSD